MTNKGSTTNQELPRVFLAHSSEDHAVVGRIAYDLTKRGIQVWFDEWELKVGDSLHDKIEQGILGSGYLAVFLSPDSVKSSWVRKELNASLTIELEKRRVFVLPALIEECEVPLFLKDKMYADFRKSYKQGLEKLLGRIIPSDAVSTMLKNIDKLELQFLPSFTDDEITSDYDLNRIFQAINSLEQRVGLDITSFPLMRNGQRVSVRDINQFLNPIVRLRNSVGLSTNWKHHPVKPGEMYSAAHLNEIYGSVNEVIRKVLAG